MVAARSAEDTPVVVPARASTDTVKAVRCDSLLTGTICGSSSRASSDSSIGTQMMPLVWRIMKATASGVVCSAAMMRSPSFSRSSSSMMMTMRPARSSARISVTALSRASPGGGAALPDRGRILDMTGGRVIRHGIITDVAARLPNSPARGCPLRRQQWHHGLFEGLLSDSRSCYQPCTHYAAGVDDPGHRHRERRPETVYFRAHRQRRGVAEALHDLHYRAAVGGIIDTQSQQLQSTPVVAFVERIEPRHLGAAGRAPRRPEVHDDHLATQRRKVEQPAVELRYDQRGSGLAHLRRAGTRRRQHARERQ